MDVISWFLGVIIDIIEFIIFDLLIKGLIIDTIWTPLNSWLLSMLNPAVESLIPIFVGFILYIIPNISIILFSKTEYEDDSGTARNKSTGEYTSISTHVCLTIVSIVIINLVIYYIINPWFLEQEYRVYNDMNGDIISLIIYLLGNIILGTLSLLLVTVYEAGGIGKFLRSAKKHF